MIKLWIYSHISAFRALFILVATLAAVALITLGNVSALIFLLTAIATAVFFDTLSLLIKTGKLVFSVKPLISGLFIGSVLGFGLPLWAPITAAAAAMLGKHFIRPGGRHLFNPAMAGMVLVVILTRTPLAWWVAGSASVPLIIATFLILNLFIKVYPVPVGFLPVHVLLTALIFKLPTGALILEPTILYFSFFMLTEPKTSPGSTLGRLFHGLLAGVLSIVYVVLPYSLALPAALLTANLCRPVTNGLAARILRARAA